MLIVRRLCCERSPSLNVHPRPSGVATVDIVQGRETVRLENHMFMSNILVNCKTIRLKIITNKRLSKRTLYSGPHCVPVLSNKTLLDDPSVIMPL